MDARNKAEKKLLDAVTALENMGMAMSARRLRKALPLLGSSYEMEEAVDEVGSVSSDFHDDFCEKEDALSTNLMSITRRAFDACCALLQESLTSSKVEPSR